MLNVILNIILFIFKFIGGKLTNSVSVMADAFNNLTDAGITLAGYLGLKISSLGAGENHPNGHGRFEWVIALLSSTSVILVGYELGKDSIESIINPTVSVFNLFTILVLLVSIIIKMTMYFYNIKIGKEKNSSTNKAIAADSLSDSLATFAVLFSLILYKLTNINIDGWCGSFMSIFIIYSGINSFSDTASRIMGKAPAKEELDNMKSFVLQNSDFQNIYDLQIEDYGYGRYRVSMIVEGKIDIDGDKLIQDVTEMTSSIYEKFGYNALISLEKPMDDKNKEKIKNDLDNIIKAQSVPIKLISLRLCAGVNKNILHIVMGIPHDYFSKQNEVQKIIYDKLSSILPDYSLILKVQFLRVHYKRRGKW